MPPRIVANQDGMGACCHLGADRLEMLVHCLGIHRRLDDGGADATVGADRAFVDLNREAACHLLAQIQAPPAARHDMGFVPLPIFIAQAVIEGLTLISGCAITT